MNGTNKKTMLMCIKSRKQETLNLSSCVNYYTDTQKFIKFMLHLSTAVLLGEMCPFGPVQLKWLERKFWENVPKKPKKLCQSCH